MRLEARNTLLKWFSVHGIARLGETLVADWVLHSEL